MEKVLKYLFENYHMSMLLIFLLYSISRCFPALASGDWDDELDHEMTD